MSLNFGLKRIAILIGAIVGFAVFGGFDMMWISDQTDARVWLASMFAFFAGAVCISIIDHESGHMEPRTNLRGVYVVMGIILIAGAAWFIIGMRSK